MQCDQQIFLTLHCRVFFSFVDLATYQILHIQKLQLAQKFTETQNLLDSKFTFFEEKDSTFPFFETRLENSSVENSGANRICFQGQL